MASVPGETRSSTLTLPSASPTPGDMSSRLASPAKTQMRWQFFFTCICGLEQASPQKGFYFSKNADQMNSMNMKPGKRLRVRVLTCLCECVCLCVCVCTCVLMCFRDLSPAQARCRSWTSGAVRTCGATSAWGPRGGCTSSQTPSSDTASPGERTERRPSREYGSSWIEHN